MKSMVEITFESPCAGRLESILEWIDSGSAGDPGVQAHVRGCPRCERFAESLRSEREALPGSTAWGRGSSARSGRSALAGFDRWLAASLRLRSDLALARSIAAVARAVMRTDADYADRFAPGSVRPAAERLDELIPTLEALVRGETDAGERRQASPGSGRPKSRSLSGRIAGILRQFDSTHDARASAGDLLEAAIGIAPDCSLAWILRANLAWTSGDPRDVRTGYERARETASSDRESALALLNLAVLAVDSGDAGSALSWSRASMEAAPSMLCRANRVVWCSFLDRESEAEDLMRSIASEPDGHRAAWLVRPAALSRQADALARLFDVPRARKERIMRGLTAWSALLRAGSGLHSPDEEC